jgi:hypothetical protein
MLSVGRHAVLINGILDPLLHCPAQEYSEKDGGQ